MKIYTREGFTNKINDKINECESCGNGKMKGGVASNVLKRKDLDVVFIAQNPGASNYGKAIEVYDIIPFGIENENRYNYFFYILFRLFKRKFKRKLCFLMTNVFKCVTEDNSIDESVVDECSKRFLEKEIRYIMKKNDKIKILTIGSLAKKRYSMMSKKFGLEWHSCEHPGFLNRKGNEFVEEKANDVFKEMFL